MTFQPVSSIRAIALLAALLAALGIAGCGRKGALDPPPSASAANQEETSVQREGGTTGLPVIRGPNKRIPLDALLD